MTTNYPRLTHSDIQEFIDTVVRSGIDDHAVRRFLDGKNVDESGFRNAELERAVETLIADCGELRNSDLEPVEARHCGSVFLAIESKFHDGALGDVEFWNYLAVRHFWRFTSLRQESAWSRAMGAATDIPTDEADRAKLERYLLGKDHYQLPLRMYLRAQAIRDDHSFDLAEIAGGSTDFWRSQVLGVRTALYPAVARTVTRAQEKARLNIEEQRPAGRRVNRLRVNIDFVLHDDTDAAGVIGDLWAVTSGDRERVVEKKAPAKKAAAKKAAAKKAAAKKAASKKAASTRVAGNSM